MPRAADSRAGLRRALVVNALTKPVNVLVPAGVVVAGGLLGAAWLAAVAVVCWLALAAFTFFDEAEAQRVGASRRAKVGGGDREPVRADLGSLDPAIARRLGAAHTAQASIRKAVESSELPLADVLGEVDSLVAAMEAQAARAQRIHEFLADRTPDAIGRRIANESNPDVVSALEAQREAVTRLREHHRQLLAEMDHVAATLDTVHAEVLAADGLDDAMARRAVAVRVVDLRTNVQLVSEGLEEAFEETRERVRADP